VRILRSLAASAAGLTLAVSGHRLGGGEIASGGVIAAVFTTVFVVCCLLSNRRLATGQIVGLLLIAQVIVHTACVFGGSMVALGPAMVLGHILATAIASWLLLRGEGFLWTMADHFGLRAVRLMFTPLNAVGPTQRLRFSRTDICPPPRLVLVGGKGLRGPPAGCS